MCSRTLKRDESVQILYRPSDLCRRPVGPDLRVGPDRPTQHADFGISRSRSAAGDRARAISGCEPESDRRDGGDADRRADQRRREHALYEQPSDDRRSDDPHRHLQARHRSRPCDAADPKPGAARGIAPAGRGTRAGHHDGQKLDRLDPGRALAVAQRPLRHDVSAQLRAAQRQRPPGPRRRRRRSADLRRRRLLDAHLAGSPESRRTRPCRQPDHQRDPRAERAGRGRHRRRLAERAGRRHAALGQCPGPPADRRRVRRHHRQHLADRRHHLSARRGADRAGRLGLCAALAAQQQAGGGAADFRGAWFERDSDRRQCPAP